MGGGNLDLSSEINQGFFPRVQLSYNLELVRERISATLAVVNNLRRIIDAFRAIFKIQKIFIDRALRALSDKRDKCKEENLPYKSPKFCNYALHILFNFYIHKDISLVQ